MIDVPPLFGLRLDKIVRICEARAYPNHSIVYLVDRTVKKSVGLGDASRPKRRGSGRTDTACAQPKKAAEIR
jgi:hypothetical protein